MVNLRRSNFSWKALLPVGANRDHSAAHVIDENVDLAEAFPLTMVVICGFDLLLDWQRWYADVLWRKGKAVQVAEFPDAFHGFYGFSERADANKVLHDMAAFVESNMAAMKPVVGGVPAMPVRAYRAVLPDGPAFQAQPGPPFVSCQPDLPRVGSGRAVLGPCWAGRASGWPGKARPDSQL